MSEKQLIWDATLDEDKYDCAVYRIDADHGQLTVIERATGEKLVDEQVGLAYGAAYGPDVADIASWQEIICKKIPE